MIPRVAEILQKLFPQDYFHFSNLFSKKHYYTPTTRKLRAFPGRWKPFLERRGLSISPGTSTVLAKRELTTGIPTRRHKNAANPRRRNSYGPQALYITRKITSKCRDDLPQGISSLPRYPDHSFDIGKTFSSALPFDWNRPVMSRLTEGVVNGNVAQHLVVFHSASMYSWKYNTFRVAIELNAVKCYTIWTNSKIHYAN